MRKIPNSYRAPGPSLYVRLLPPSSLLGTSISSTHIAQTLASRQTAVSNHEIRVTFDLRLLRLLQPLNGLGNERLLVFHRPQFLELRDPDGHPIAGGDGGGHLGLERFEVVVHRAGVRGVAAIPVGYKLDEG